MHNAVRIVLLRVVSCLRFINLFPPGSKLLLGQVQVLPHLVSICVCLDIAPEFRALVLVAKSEGVAKLMDDQMLLEIIAWTAVVQVEVHRWFRCLDVLCPHSQGRITNKIVCSKTCL